MLTDYLARPLDDGAASSPLPPEGNAFFREVEDRLGPNWRERRPVYRPGLDKDDLKRLLAMILHLENAVADMNLMHPALQATENQLVESAGLVPEALHALYGKAIHAVTYAQSALPWQYRDDFNVDSLRARHDPWYTVENDDDSLLTGLVHHGHAFECPAFETPEAEAGYRYLLACATGVHSGMSWAADCLADYTFEELQAALLLCPTPYRIDWRTCPLETMFAEYLAALRRENAIFEQRKPSLVQSEGHYGRRHRVPAMRQFIRNGWELVKRFCVPTAFHMEDWLHYCALDHRGSMEDWLHYCALNQRGSDVTFIWSPYMLGTLAMALRNTLVQRRHNRETLSVTLPPLKRYLALPPDEAIPAPRTPGVTVQVFRADEGARLGLPEAIGALRLANVGNQYLPCIPVNDTALDFTVLLFPSTTMAMELLLNVYGIPRPSRLIRLPPELEGLTDITSPKYGQTLSAALSLTLYEGLRDIRPLVQDVEARPPEECPPLDLFHALIKTRIAT